MRGFAFVACLSLSAIACASPGIPSTAGTEQVVSVSGQSGTQSVRYQLDASRSIDTVAAPVAVAWRRLIAQYASLGIPLSAFDSVAHVIAGVKGSSVRRLGNRPLSAVIDCGQSGFGTARVDTYLVTLTVASQLQPIPAGTRIVSSISAFAQDPNVSSTQVQCSSRGILEQEIASAVGKS